jgi:hypothetical protein
VHLDGFHYKNNHRSPFWCIPIGSFATINTPILSHNSSYIPQSPNYLDMLNLIISDDEEFNDANQTPYTWVHKIKPFSYMSSTSVIIL